MLVEILRDGETDTPLIPAVVTAAVNLAFETSWERWLEQPAGTKEWIDAPPPRIGAESGGDGGRVPRSREISGGLPPEISIVQ